jgi:hypothetical protein
MMLAQSEVAVMLRTSLLSSLVLLAVGISAVNAAPMKPKISDHVTVDRWVEIRDPGQLVGPQIDPTGPLKKIDPSVFEPVPDPWRNIPQVEVRIPGH